MNSLAIELIKDGLIYRESAERNLKELNEQGGSFDARLTEIETRIADFAATTYTQLNQLCKEHALMVKTSSACCNLSEAILFGETVTREQLDSGYYDFLPVRFWRAS